MSDEKSDRQRREAARQAAHNLRKDPAWNPAAAPRDPRADLRDLANAERTEDAYAESDECPVCRIERKKSGDDSALCEIHLAEAMGF